MKKKNINLLVISLCTQGIMRDYFIYYCKMFSENYNLYCITNDNVTNAELSAIRTLNLSYKRNNPFGYFSLKKLKCMKKYIEDINPDIVYVFTHHATSILIANYLKRYRLIYQVHDPKPHEGVSLLNRLILNIQLKQYSRKADKLVVAGEAIKKQILEICKIDEKKIIPIPFAVLDNHKVENAENINEKVDVLFYGRIEPYKGIDTLIASSYYLPQNINIFIAGGGDLHKAYPKIGKIPNNIRLLGFLEEKKLVSFIKASKIVIFPYKEASGTMTICECCYYGKALIVTNVGVLPEYTGNAGLVVEHENPRQLAKAIMFLLKNDITRKKFEINSKLRYDAMFTMENACKCYQRLFDQIMCVNVGK